MIATQTRRAVGQSGFSILTALDGRNDSSIVVIAFGQTLQDLIPHFNHPILAFLEIVVGLLVKPWLVFVALIAEGNQPFHENIGVFRKQLVFLVVAFRLIDPLLDCTASPVPSLSDETLVPHREEDDWDESSAIASEIWLPAANCIGETVALRIEEIHRVGIEIVIFGGGVAPHTATPMVILAIDYRKNQAEMSFSRMFFLLLRQYHSL